MCSILSAGVHFVSCMAPTIGSTLSPSLFIHENVDHNWLITKGFFAVAPPGAQRVDLQTVHIVFLLYAMATLIRI